MKFYVGCGSCDTPEEILHLMRGVAETLATKGITLRSSETGAADRAFIKGSKGKRFCFIPFADLDYPSNWAVCSEAGPTSVYSAFARKLNPGYLLLSTPEKQWEVVANTLVYGSTGSDKAKMLICWTEDGATCPAEFTDATGHTARYIKTAHAAGVPIFNLQRPGHRGTVRSWLSR